MSTVLDDKNIVVTDDSQMQLTSESEDRYSTVFLKKINEDFIPVAQTTMPSTMREDYCSENYFTNIDDSADDSGDQMFTSDDRSLRAQDAIKVTEERAQNKSISAQQTTNNVQNEDLTIVNSSLEQYQLDQTIIAQQHLTNNPFICLAMLKHCRSLSMYQRTNEKPELQNSRVRTMVRVQDDFDLNTYTQNNQGSGFYDDPSDEGATIINT